MASKNAISVKIDPWLLLSSRYDPNLAGRDLACNVLRQDDNWEGIKIDLNSKSRLRTGNIRYENALLIDGFW